MTIDEKDNLDGFVFVQGMRNMVAILDAQGCIAAFTHHSYATLRFNRAYRGEPLANKYVHLNWKSNVHTATLINIGEKEKGDVSTLWQFMSPTAPPMIMITIAGIIVFVSDDESRINKAQNEFKMQLFHEWDTKAVIQRIVSPTKKRRIVLDDDDGELYLW